MERLGTWTVGVLMVVFAAALVALVALGVVLLWRAAL